MARNLANFTGNVKTFKADWKKASDTLTALFSIANNDKEKAAINDVKSIGDYLASKLLDETK